MVQFAIAPTYALADTPENFSQIKQDIDDAGIGFEIRSKIGNAEGTDVTVEADEVSSEVDVEVKSDEDKDENKEDNKRGVTLNTLDAREMADQIEAPFCEHFPFLSWCDGKGDKDDLVSVKIIKKWQDVDGDFVNAPGNKGDLKIIAESSETPDGVTCEYSSSDIDCDDDLLIFPGDKISIDEVKVPSGWKVHSGIGSAVEPKCDADTKFDFVCTHTIINRMTSDVGGDEDKPCPDPASFSIASGAKTQFWGMTPNEPRPLSDDLDYTIENSGSFAVAANAEDWDIAEGDPNLSGAAWVSNSATAPSNPPTGDDDGITDGTIDSWRLFSHTFNIPSGSTDATARLSFTGDDEVTAFIDNNKIGFSDDATKVTNVHGIDLSPGDHELEFSVLNIGDRHEKSNPTGVIYEMKVKYCAKQVSTSGSRRGGGRVLGDVDFGPGLQMPPIAQGPEVVTPPSVPGGEVLGEELPVTGMDGRALLLTLSLLSAPLLGVLLRKLRNISAI